MTMRGWSVLGAVIAMSFAAQAAAVTLTVERLGTMTVRVAGNLDVRRGDSLWLTADEVCWHRCDEHGRAIRSSAIAL